MKRTYLYYIAILFIICTFNYFLNWKIVFSLGITFFLFFLFHLILILRAFILDDKRKLKLNILFSFSYLVLTLKIYYTYYNIIFSIILLSFFILILTKKQILDNKSYKITFYFLFVLNIIFLITPDKYIDFKKLDNQILWNPNIKWSNFKGVSKKDSVFAAEIHTNFRGNNNRVYNFPPAIVYSTMLINKSWVNEQYKRDSLLLMHEQKHFDIKEFFSIKAQDSINQSWGKTPSEIKNIVKYFADKEDKYQDKYDSITNHGFDRQQQIEFNIKILNLINEYKNDT